jgi:hypothetical protein
MRGLPVLIVAGLHSTMAAAAVSMQDYGQGQIITQAPLERTDYAHSVYFDEMSHWPIRLPPVERKPKWRGFTGAAADLNKSERAKRQKRARAITRKHR